MVKNSENLKKSFKSFFFLQKLKKNLQILLLTKKSSLFLNIRTTQFDQSSPVPPNPENKNLENLKKNLKKITWFKKKYKEINFIKKNYTFSFSIFRGRDSTRALQYSRF